MGSEKRDGQITNTTEQVKSNPLGALVESIGGGPEKLITGMEKRGTQELAAQNTKLPVEGSGDPLWAKLGFVWGEPVAGDPLFRNVTMPAGWRLQTTDHDMWNKLLDEKGRERASIFYKAAFYDRRAQLHPPNKRFGVSARYEKNDFNSSAVTVIDRVTTPETVLREWPMRTQPKDYSDTDGYAAARAMTDADRTEAIAWLTKERPQHEDPLAYWNE